MGVIMQEKYYTAAVAEAKRFLEVAARLEKECELQGENCQRGIPGHYLPSKQTGALRRASMDLTRALTELRRGKS